MCARPCRTFTRVLLASEYAGSRRTRMIRHTFRTSMTSPVRQHTSPHTYLHFTLYRIGLFENLKYYIIHCIYSNGVSFEIMDFGTK